MRRTDAALEWLDHPYLYGTERERARRGITHGVVPAPPTRAVCSNPPPPPSPSPPPPSAILAYSEARGKCSGPRRAGLGRVLRVLARAAFGHMVCTVCTTQPRSRELNLDSLFGSKLST
eukprot:scaffold9990_cov36-Phaeocystis_antarctica.AAC.2